MKRTVVSLAFLVGCQFEIPRIECPAEFAPIPGAPAGHVYWKTPENGTRPNDGCSFSGTWASGNSYMSYLAVPNDATELLHLYELAGLSMFWVGINDRGTEGVFISEERSRTVVPAPATFLPWAAGEPSNNIQYQDYVFATATTISVVEGGSLSLPVICECNPD